MSRKGFTILEYGVWGNTHWELNGEEHDSVSSGLFIEWVNVSRGTTVGKTCKVHPKFVDREFGNVGGEVD